MAKGGGGGGAERSGAERRGEEEDKLPIKWVSGIWDAIAYRVRRTLISDLVHVCHTQFDYNYLK